MNKLDYDLDKDAPLEVTTPSYDTAFHGTINIRANSLRINSDNYYYRMDGNFLKGDTFIWPLKDVLAGLELRPNNLGVFAWQEFENSNLYIPLYIYQQSDNDPDHKSAWIYLKALWSREVDEVIWQIVGGENKSSEERTATNGPLDAGHPITIKIPPGSAGLDSIKISAWYRGKWFPNTVRLLRPDNEK
jgi:hypothetical protein